MHERIKRIHAVSSMLATQGLPVRVPYDQRILTLTTADTTRYAALYEYLPGATIPWEGYTKHHIKLVGMAMGHIHAASLSAPMANSPHVADDCKAICIRMNEYFNSHGVQDAMQRKLQLKIDMQLFKNYLYLLGQTKLLPGQRMLHMDLVRGNILFTKIATKDAEKLQVGNFAISGIIDFEKTAYGHPVFDIARSLAFLLVDSKYKSPEKIRKYFLESGYAKRGKQKIPRITYQKNGETCSVLDTLIEFFLVHDFYKFLRHNPYESLNVNEHFMRTRTMLVERKVVTEL